MSRRMRLEEERAHQLKDELQEEEFKIKLVQEKIFGPLVWRRLGNGVKIQDLKPNYYNDAVRLIMDHFTKEDVLFRNTKFAEDPISKDSFARKITFKLKNRTSVIALDEGHNNQVAGVLILTPVRKSDYDRVYSRTMLTEGSSYRSITEFMNYVNQKVNVFDQYHHDIYLQFYILCITPEYRGKGLGYHLMRVGMDVARHLKIPLAMGVFNTYRMQRLAAKVGINQTLYEMEYKNWTDPSNELVFCDLGHGNYTCAVMAGPVTPFSQGNDSNAINTKQQ